MNPIQSILEHKIFVGITVIGGLIFTLWEPLTSLFYTGYFHTNIVLDLNAEIIPVAKNKQLLVVHVIPSNKGNVPLIIKNQNVFTLEIRKISKIESNQWVDYPKQKLIGKIDLLRNIVLKNGDSYTLEPNSVYDEVESIQLENGIYYINAIFNFDGEYVNQSQVVKLPAKN